MPNPRKSTDLKTLRHLLGVTRLGPMLGRSDGVSLHASEFGFWLIESFWGSSMRLRPAQFLLSVLLAVFLTYKLIAQTTTSGAISGIITDPSSAVVPNAEVEIKDGAKALTQSTKTDREGIYNFVFLSPGGYTLVVSHEGFPEERRTVDVLLGPPITVNSSL